MKLNNETFVLGVFCIIPVSRVASQSVDFDLTGQSAREPNGRERKPRPHDSYFLRLFFGPVHCPSPMSHHVCL